MLDELKLSMLLTFSKSEAYPVLLITSDTIQMITDCGHTAYILIRRLAY